jgi:hypothetical protein
MHPVIVRELAAEHIREIHARAEDGHLAHQARRRTRFTRLRLRASGTLSYDDPRLDPGQPPVMHEQPSAPPVAAMVGSPPDGGDAITRREALDHCY